MPNTTNLDIPLVRQNQAQKEVTVNEAFIRIDAILNRGAVDKDLATPPGSPATGSLYIVAASPTGAWSGHATHLTYFNQSWQFIIPNEGFTVWVNDENALYGFNGAAWVQISTPANPQFSHIGVGTAADGTHLINLYGISILYNSGGSFTQQMNKNAAGDSLKLLFQQAFTTYAELGLIGDNDFRLKVSDGTNFFEAWVIDHLTGNTDFKKEVTQNSSAVRVAGKTSDWIPAQLITPNAGSEAAGALTAIEITGGKPHIKGLVFGNSGVKRAQASVQLPKSWNEGGFEVRVHWLTQDATGGNVRWKVTAVAISDGDNQASDFAGDTNIDDTSTGQNKKNITPSTLISIGGTIATGDNIELQISRQYDGTNDTINASVYLLGVEVIYTTNAKNDA